MKTKIILGVLFLIIVVAAFQTGFWVGDASDDIVISGRSLRKGPPTESTKDPHWKPFHYDNKSSLPTDTF